MTENQKNFLAEEGITKIIRTDMSGLEQLQQNPNYYSYQEIDAGMFDVEMLNVEISDNEVMKEALFAINRKTKTLMNCSIFFVAFTLIGMLASFLLLLLRI